MKPNDIQTPARFPHKTMNVSPDRAWIPGDCFAYEGTGAGSAYFSNIIGYSLPDAISSYARGIVACPHNWGGHAVRFTIAWRPLNGSAGNVRFDTALRQISDGVSFGTVFGSESSLIDAASGNADTAVVTTVDYAAIPTNWTYGNYIQMAINRRGDVGADDTYAYAIYLIAAGLEVI